MTTAELAEIAYPLPSCGDESGAFHARRPVRLADTDADERLRLDGVARYLMDVGYDHLQVADDGDRHPAWIVRRTVIDVLRPLRFGDTAELLRRPAALSTRWCNMRIRLRGDDGGLAEAEAFLINVDPEAGRPARISDRFMAPMLATTTEHRLRWRAAPAELDGGGGAGRPFALRVADVDRHGHVNNVVHWAAVEEELARYPWAHTPPYRAIVEHIGPIMIDDTVTIRTRELTNALHIQLEVDGVAKTLARVTPLP
jgi:acyl-ACP thioesterase